MRCIRKNDRSRGVRKTCRFCLQTSVHACDSFGPNAEGGNMLRVSSPKINFRRFLTIPARKDGTFSLIDKSRLFLDLDLKEFGRVGLKELKKLHFHLDTGCAFTYAGLTIVVCAYV